MLPLLPPPPPPAGAPACSLCGSAAAAPGGEKPWPEEAGPSTAARKPDADAEEGRPPGPNMRSCDPGRRPPGGESPAGLWLTLPPLASLRATGGGVRRCTEWSLELLELPAPPPRGSLKLPSRIAALCRSAMAAQRFKLLPRGRELRGGAPPLPPPPAAAAMSAALASGDGAALLLAGAPVLGALLRPPMTWSGTLNGAAAVATAAP